MDGTRGPEMEWIPCAAYALNTRHHILPLEHPQRDDTHASRRAPVAVVRQSEPPIQRNSHVTWGENA